MTGRGYMRWTPDLIVLHIRAWIAMTGCAPAYRDFDAALGKMVTAEASRARDGSRYGLLRLMELPNGKSVSACPQNC